MKTVTIPVIFSKPATMVRREWSCKDGKLPEPVTWNGTIVDPSSVHVDEIRYVTIQEKLDEYWTLLWVTITGEDDKMPVVNIQRHTPLISPPDTVRGKQPDGKFSKQGSIPVSQSDLIAASK